MSLLQFIFLFSFLWVFPFSLRAAEPAVVSADALASKAGMEILKKGGSAIDAAVATAFALAVVEPQHSGLGGGGFLLYFDAKSRLLHFLDYREVSPKNVGPLVKNPDLLGGGITSVGVPGFVMGMETMHKRWRKLSWPAVLEPAIELADKGTPLSPSLQQNLEKKKDELKKEEEFADSYLKALNTGSVKQDDLVATLKDIKTGGTNTFYKGDLSKKILAEIKKRNGLITTADLAGYRAYWRRPHQFDYGPYRVVSAPPPSSGGVGLELLFKKTIVNHLAEMTPAAPETYRALLGGLKDYFDYREIALGDTPMNIIGHTTHLGVIDRDGNIAVMTNSLNNPFGSGILVPGTGILLNDELGDFSKGKNTLNRIRPGVRPLSSMAPTIVFKNGRPVLAIGTPGGTTIPQNLYQIFLSSWDYKRTLQQAIRQPKIYYSPRDEAVVVEKSVSKKVVRELERDNKIIEKNSIGNVQALIFLGETKTLPISDPRGEGAGLTD